MSAELAFQTALLDQLRADAGVQAVLGGRVLDRLEPGVRYPLLYPGRSESEPRDGGETRLIEHRLTLVIRGWRDDARALKAVIGAIRASLETGAPALDPPHACVLAHLAYADLFSSADSRMLQGLVRVRALIETQGDTP